MNYDILVIGSGIGGMEAALKLGDMGYRVLLVEKEPSIGGKMILLSKVFPTLDCASCISTPKMAAAAHHPNVQVMVYTEVKEIKKNGSGTFQARLRKKPTFVDPALCTGCQQCETACTVAVPDQFNFGLVARRAAYIAFPQAVPKKAVIERAGTSPCSFACPAGIRAHGYVSLVRSGKYEEACRLILESAPFPGSLGRACYARCEQECTRAGLEGPVAIRQIKRFVADYYYGAHPEPEDAPPIAPSGKKVAVIGAGPAGLSAAFHLAKKGHAVEVFEAAPLPGGMLRYAIPAYRIPREVLDRDIKNVTTLGVKINQGKRVTDLAGLKDKGFDAVFIATGTPRGRKMKVEGEDLAGVVNALDFLRDVNAGRVSLQGKTVLVVGGGNVAIDAARTAMRLGAARVTVQYRRSRAQMPAHDWEIEAAGREGVVFEYLAAPVRFLGENGKLAEVESVQMELSEPAADGRRIPVSVVGTERKRPADLVVIAVGLEPETEYFGDQLAVNADKTIQVNPATLQTSIPFVFAGGDVVTGPSSIARAVGHGRRAAFFIDRYLRGEDLAGAEVEFDCRLPVVSKEEVLKRQESYRDLPPVSKKEILREKPGDFTEVELPLTEEEARSSAGRCLDCGVCAECRQCVATCPAGAINLAAKEAEKEVEVGSVIISTGLRLFPAGGKPQYGYGRFKNVLDAMQMDRLLAPTRPYNTVLRPSDGKIPNNIAYVLCTGSRDATVGNPLCSRVCCMYSLKQAQLLTGVLPLADVTVYYIDIRAFGKGYEEFYEQAKGMGVYFVKGRISWIEEKEDGNLLLTYEDIENGGKLSRAEHDLVVLSVGFLPAPEVRGLFSAEELAVDEFGYIREVEEDVNPGKTSIAGVFAAGSVSGARDIPDSILHAGAAAAQAAAYVERIRGKK
ncbi:MAG: FAD-dependent oxidoreductase [Armatimonadetes bacterium]|nr:FAD-dependent oxidoreductase [Armatimonadota bacterium]